MESGIFFADHVGNGIADKQAYHGGDNGQLKRAAKHHSVGTHAGEVCEGKVLTSVVRQCLRIPFGNHRLLQTIKIMFHCLVSI